MPLQAINPTNTDAWKNLKAHFSAIKNQNMNTWFEENPNRESELLLHWEDFYLDLSKNRIKPKTLELLYKLADEMQLKDAIEKYFNGDFINETENRAVLHTALRTNTDLGIQVNGTSVFEAVKTVRDKIEKLTNRIISGDKKGFTNKQFTDIVNIGIGGSDLGPMMAVEALKNYKTYLNVHFVNNIDADAINLLLSDLNPETTLFIITSKSFSTLETLENAKLIRSWFTAQLNEVAVNQHFIAVSNNVEAAQLFGILEANIFPMWDWVGGRYSLWSAVGLSISLAIGYNNFSKLLDGAYEMDVHFKESSFEKNIPVTLALLSVWYTNFFSTNTEAVISYNQGLKHFAPFLQQLVMESNGKSTDRNGNRLAYNTSPIIWGGVGTNVQHAFCQLIHQGNTLIPVDFIGFKKPNSNTSNQHHLHLLSNLVAQSEALLVGRSSQEIEKTSDKNMSNIYKVFDGNKPSSVLIIDKLTPKSLGKLIAMYEHKTFVQGVLWNIYSFDQFGVELGKVISKETFRAINNSKKPTNFSSKALISHLKKSN